MQFEAFRINIITLQLFFPAYLRITAPESPSSIIQLNMLQSNQIWAPGGLCF